MLSTQPFIKCDWFDCSQDAQKAITFGLRVIDVAGRPNVHLIPYEASRNKVCEAHFILIKDSYVHCEETDLIDI